MKHIIIDTDPGVDDALALMLALNSSELNVEAITTVVGNVNLNLSTLNALKILEFLDKEVPVASGAFKPLVRRARNAPEFHGKSGLGEVTLPEPKLKPDSRTAVQLIIDMITKFGEELTLVTIGPLTNIATTIIVKPEIIDQIAGLVIMGGAYFMTSYGHGNINAVAEYNIWHDPEAAKLVFESGIPITAVGLDVTKHPDNRLNGDIYTKIKSLGTKKSIFITDLCRNIFKRYNGLGLHDPLTIAVTIDKDLATTKKCNVKIETLGDLTRGMTVVDRRFNKDTDESNDNVNVCTSINSKKFLKMFMDRVVYNGV